LEILQDGDTYYVNISIDEIGFFTDSTPVIEYVPVYVPVAEEKIELSSKLKKRILRHAKWRSFLFILGLRSNYSVEDLFDQWWGCED